MSPGTVGMPLSSLSKYNIVLFIRLQFKLYNSLITISNLNNNSLSLSNYAVIWLLKIEI